MSKLGGISQYSFSQHISVFVSATGADKLTPNVRSLSNQKDNIYLHALPISCRNDPRHGLALKLKSYGVVKRELMPNVIKEKC